MNRRTTLVVWTAMAPILVAVLSFCSPPPPSCTPAPSASAGPIPPDAVACSSSITPRTDAFANLAWQAFKMTVWPAARSRFGVPLRGEPDTARKLADLDGPRVFETYKADWETFLRSAALPSEWSEHPATASPCSNDPKIEPGTLVLAALAEFGNVDEQAGNDPHGKPITNVLVGQNRKLARYLVAFDRNEFELIRTNRLYDSGSLPLPGGPAPASATAPNGTIIVKSAWIELDGLKVDHDTFYHRRALVQDPVSLVCEEAEVGLVGLHLRYKTPTRPQWVWASFEHVCNVPSRDCAASVRKPTAYTFNDGSGMRMPEDPPPDTVVHSMTFSAHPDPFNVERVRPLVSEIAAANVAWRGALAGSVWANYQLVIVQWPGMSSYFGSDALEAKPEPPSFTGQTANLVNTTMETFLQKKVGPNDGIVFTCMGCHNGARGLDYTFAIMLNASSSSHMAPSPWRRRAIDYLRSLVNQPATR